MTSAPPVRRGFTLLDLLVVISILAILVALFLPAVRTARGTARATQCRHNLQQIGIALHAYAEQYNTLPPATLVHADGQPLHSWRTLILPQIDQSALFRQVDLARAWNDPANATLRETRLPILCCPDSPGWQERPTNTQYLGLVGEQQFFHPHRPRQLPEMAGSPLAVAITEVPVKNAVPWMQPADTTAAFFHGINGQSALPHGDTFHVARVDGTITGVAGGKDMELSTTIRADADASREQTAP